jgi:hypothetical protein
LRSCDCGVALGERGVQLLLHTRQHVDEPLGPLRAALRRPLELALKLLAPLLQQRARIGLDALGVALRVAELLSQRVVLLARRLELGGQLAVLFARIAQRCHLAQRRVALLRHKLELVAVRVDAQLQRLDVVGQPLHRLVWRGDRRRGGGACTALALAFALQRHGAGVALTLESDGAGMRSRSRAAAPSRRSCSSAAARIGERVLKLDAPLRQQLLGADCCRRAPRRRRRRAHDRARTASASARRRSSRTSALQRLDLRVRASGRLAGGKDGELLLELRLALIGGDAPGGKLLVEHGETLGDVGLVIGGGAGATLGGAQIGERLVALLRHLRRAWRRRRYAPPQSRCSACSTQR